MFYIKNLPIQNANTNYSTITTTYTDYTVPIEPLVTDHYSTFVVGTEDIMKNYSSKLSNFQKKDILKLPDFPHANCWIDDKHTLHLCFALAGYLKENVSVETSKNNEIYIKAKPTKEDSNKIFLERRISNKDIDISLTLDKVYDLEKAEVKFEQGLLTIVIPRSAKAIIKKLL